MMIYHLINNTAAFKRQGVYFDSIEYWIDSIFNHLQFSQTEVRFLELTTEHIHPSFVKTRVNNQIGSSIIKIYDSFLRTKGAKKYLKRIFLNPTYDSKELDQRHSTVQWMIRWMSDKKYYSKIFSKIHSVDAIVQRFQRERIEEDDWRKLIKSLEGIMELRNSLSLDNPP
jgi:DNA mismatch repair ATPase MutS